MKEALNFNKLFEAKPLNTEETEWTVLLGGKVATPLKYRTKREAIAAIHGRDWNLIATLTVALHNAMENASQNLENVNKTKETKKED